MPGISDLLDSDMEENNYINEDSIISSVSDTMDIAPETESATTAKKSKKRHRVTMPKSKSRAAKASPGPQTAKLSKKTATTKSKAIEASIETAAVIDTQQEDVMEAEVSAKPRRKPAAKKSEKKVKAAVQHEQQASNGMEVEQTPAAARSNFAKTATSKSAPKVAKVSKTQTCEDMQTDAIQEAANKDDSLEPELEEIDELISQQPPPKRARTESRSRQEPVYRRRAGSASDTERGDPNLRRKLGDVTRKFENIDMKYKNLKEVGISEANANVEKLRKQCEATTEASNNLIASLKKELGQQAPLVQDARKLKKDLQTREEELAKIRTSQIELTASLTSAQNEIRSLQAKLAAARTASVEPQPAKPPGSAIKAVRSAAVTNAEAIQAAQVAQMKLDLYGDLTGLIVRSVKRAEDGDTYDCIQTGRNGTLHFKLFIDQEDAKSASFEETEFLYTPLLDANRDRDMIELMPPYLTEDITFARQNAAKFYQRVVDTLTRRNNDG